MQTRSDFIASDYLEEGFIAAEPGVHGPLTFTYRPLLAAARDQAIGLVMSAPPQYGAFVDRVAEELAKNVKSWSLTDSRKDPVPINAENVKLVRPQLLDKVWGVVSGARRSDEAEAVGKAA